MTKLKKAGFNRYEAPSPSQAGDENIEESFLNDVDKFHDFLPQPFRRINKIVDDILDDSWRFIESRMSSQNQSQLSKKKIEKVLYEEELLLNERTVNINIVSANVFITSISKVLVFEIPTLSMVSSHVKKVEMNYFDTKIILRTSASTFLINQFNDDSIEVICYYQNHFVIILDPFKEGNENDNVVLRKWTVSSDGQYLALSYTDNTSSWLSVYKMPIENWCKQVATISEKDLNHNGLVDENEENVTEPNFSKLQLLIKVTPPIIKPNHSSLSQLLRAFDTDLSVKCDTMHLLSSTYFDHLQDNVGTKLNIISDISKKRQDAIGTVHFLKGEISPTVFKSDKPADASYTSIVIWWSNSNQMFFYLLKPGKDNEPINTFIHSSYICCSAVNGPTNLIATALVNGSVSIKDRVRGSLLGVLDLYGESINHLHFTSVFHGEMTDCLYISTKDGRLFESDCKKSMLSPMVLIDEGSVSTEKDEVEKFIAAPMNLLPVIWRHSGEVILYNEASKLPICSLELFNKQIGRAVIGSQLHASFGVRHIVIVRDESMDDKDQSRLFLFNVEDHNILNGFFNNALCDFADEKSKSKTLENILAEVLKERWHEKEIIKSRVTKHYKSVLQKALIVS